MPFDKGSGEVGTLHSGLSESCVRRGIFIQEQKSVCCVTKEELTVGLGRAFRSTRKGPQSMPFEACLPEGFSVMTVAWGVCLEDSHLFSRSYKCIVPCLLHFKSHLTPWCSHHSSLQSDALGTAVCSLVTPVRQILQDLPCSSLLGVIPGRALHANPTLACCFVGTWGSLG